jgi:hypothetical protein
VYVPPEAFVITAGEEYLRAFSKEDGPVRSFCEICGSKVRVGLRWGARREAMDPSCRQRTCLRGVWSVWSVWSMCM